MMLVPADLTDLLRGEQKNNKILFSYFKIFSSIYFFFFSYMHLKIILIIYI